MPKKEEIRAASADANIRSWLGMTPVIISEVKNVNVNAQACYAATWYF